MNGGNRLEDLIRGGHQQPVESETTEHANNAAGSPTTHTPIEEQKTTQKQILTIQPKNGGDLQKGIGGGLFVGILIFILILTTIIVVVVRILKQKRKAKELERALKLIPMLIHLPPSTDDIQGGGRDERDVNDEGYYYVHNYFFDDKKVGNENACIWTKIFFI